MSFGNIHRRFNYVRRQSVPIIIGSNFAFIALMLVVTLLTACSVATTASLQPIGMAAILSTDDSPTATSIADMTQREIEVEGVMQTLTATQITVGGQTFSYDPMVVVSNGIALKVGTTVELKAKVVGSAVLVVRIVPQKAEDSTQLRFRPQPIRPPLHRWLHLGR